MPTFRNDEPKLMEGMEVYTFTESEVIEALLKSTNFKIPAPPGVGPVRFQAGHNGSNPVFYLMRSYQT
jgi:hypothetical protein